jgi:hypothetical protein
MNEYNFWTQGNWYALGNLLVELAFLIAGVWFARKILSAVRASQEQFGALLKLSLTDALRERSKAAEAAPTLWDVPAERHMQYVMAEWPTAAVPALSLPEPESRRKWLLAAGRAVLQAWRAVVRWLEAPMAHGQQASWRRMIHWLQSPARS